MHKSKPKNDVQNEDRRTNETTKQQQNTQPNKTTLPGQFKSFRWTETHIPTNSRHVLLLKTKNKQLSVRYSHWPHAVTTEKFNKKFKKKTDLKIFLKFS